MHLVFTATSRRTEDPLSTNPWTSSTLSVLYNRFWCPKRMVPTVQCSMLILLHLQLLMIETQIIAYRTVPNRAVLLGGIAP